MSACFIERTLYWAHALLSARFIKRTLYWAHAIFCFKKLISKQLEFGRFFFSKNTDFRDFLNIPAKNELNSIMLLLYLKGELMSWIDLTPPGLSFGLLPLLLQFFLASRHFLPFNSEKKENFKKSWSEKKRWIFAL